MKKTLATCLFTLLAATVPVSAVAAKVSSKWDLPDRWNVNVGAFFITNANTTLGVRAAGGPASVGVGLDFSRNLNVGDRETAGRIDGYWRFSKRSRADWTYFKYERDGRTDALDIPIDLPPEFPSFDIGDPLVTQFDTDILKLAYTFSFLNSEKIELGVGAGLHISNIELELQDVNDPANKTAVSEFTAPLPVARIILNYNISPRWRWTNSVDFFYLNIGNFEGGLTDLRSALEHHTFKNVGFGFGINRFDLDLEFESSDTDFVGSLKSGWSGFLAYVTV
ncbi:MAG: hypothetical protein FVQ76_03315, partial [Nitrospira sp.]|nr:hypothetical protein [Nitrospira sp.]